MNELNLSISTGKDSNKVVLTAAFDTHEQAVAFHSAVANLCEKANNSKPPSDFSGMTRLLGWGKGTDTHP